MKYVTNAIVTLFLTSVIAGSGFGASEPATLSKPVAAAEKHAVRPRPHRRTRLTTIPYLKNSVKTIQVRRLSERQRRDVMRRLIDIRIN